MSEQRFGETHPSLGVGRIGEVLERPDPAAGGARVVSLASRIQDQISWYAPLRVQCQEVFRRLTSSSPVFIRLIGSWCTT